MDEIATRPNGIELFEDNLSIELPYMATKTRPMPCIENFQIVLDRVGVNVRQNVIKKRIEIHIPDEKFVLDNQENASYERLVGWCARFNLPRDIPGSYLNVVAARNPFNPVVNWIINSEWDGKSRLKEFFNTVRATNDELKEKLMLRWMISAIAAAFSPNGISVSGVLVFQGAQNMGKTKWFKKLVPENLDVTKDGMTLNPADKDSVMRAVSYWLVELGEVDATFRKADLAILKAFITQDRDVLRLPYARQISTFPRRTVFFASVNDKEFLHDKTGNRRWWTIECIGIDHNHSIDMQQVWCEVLHLYQNKVSWHLDVDEYTSLQTYNQDFETINTIKERIIEMYDWGSLPTEWKTATEILIECGYREPKNLQASECSATVKELNGNKTKRTGMGRYLLMPRTRSRFEVRDNPLWSSNA